MSDSYVTINYATCPNCGVAMQMSLENGRRVDTCMKCGYSRKTKVLFSTGGTIDLKELGDDWGDSTYQIGDKDKKISATTNDGILPEIKVEPSDNIFYPSPLQCESLSSEEIRVLINKAEAYDRIMSGGVKSLQEWANILNRPVVYNKVGTLLWFDEIPVCNSYCWCVDKESSWGLDYGHIIPYDKMKGEDLEQWQYSLRLPKGWENNE